MREVECVLRLDQETGDGRAQTVFWTFGRDRGPIPALGPSDPPTVRGSLFADRFASGLTMLPGGWDICEPGEIPSYRKGLGALVVRTLKRAYLTLLRPFHAELLRKQQAVNDQFAEVLYRLHQEIGRLQPRHAWEEFQVLPKFSVLMPVWDSDPQHFRQAVLSVLRQRYPFWELCICDDASDRDEFRGVLEEFSRLDERLHLVRLPRRQGIAAATNTALEQAMGDFVAFLDHDDELDRNALWDAVRYLNGHPETDLLYTDEDHLSAGLTVAPRYKPDWSPDLFLSLNYICHLVILRTSFLRQLGGLRPGFEGAQDYDLLLRATEATANIAHIPLMLYHWRKSETSVSSNMQVKPQATESGKRALEEALERRRIQGTVEVVAPGIYRVRRALVVRPLISIIIPSKDNVGELRPCLESIRDKTTYRPYEILIIDNGSGKRENQAYLSSLPYRVLRCEEPFNFSRLNNLGVRQAQGDVLLFLNDDTRVIAPDWLEAMLEHAQRPEVGLVGAKLLFPDGTIQHAGLALNTAGRPTAHVFVGADGADWGYENALRVVRNCSAVTGACMMMRRSVFLEVGGFDEGYTVICSDIDLCLKVRAQGYLIVWTPYALLQHREFGTRPRDQDPPEDMERFVARWGGVLRQSDPYHNPNLSVL